MMENYGVKTNLTTLKNPLDNKQHKSVHLLMVEVLHRPTWGDKFTISKKYTAIKEIRKLTSSVIFDLRATCSMVTKYSPSEMVFSLDVIINQKELINWYFVQKRRRKRQIIDNEKENKSRTYKLQVQYQRKIPDH